MSLRGLSVLLVAMLIALCLVEGSWAQQPRPSANAAAPDTAAGPAEAPNASADASAKAVDFSARDSLVIRTDTSGQDHGTLHGEAQM